MEILLQCGAQRCNRRLRIVADRIHHRRNIKRIHIRRIDGARTLDKLFGLRAVALFRVVQRQVAYDAGIARIDLQLRTRDRAPLLPAARLSDGEWPLGVRTMVSLESDGAKEGLGSPCVVPECPALSMVRSATESWSSARHWLQRTADSRFSRPGKRPTSNF